MKKIILLIAVLAAATSLSAQVSINNDGTLPDPSAMLEVKSTAKGLLPPRVPLTATNIASPVSAPAIGLQVYNTATSGVSPYNVSPGIYCWDGLQWVPVIAPRGANIGDMQYWNGSQWITVPAGSPGQFLQMSQENVPFWSGSNFASITTSAATSITATGAMSGGTITSDGGSSITAKGICYNTSPGPTIANSKVTAGTGTGSFSSSMTGLLANTTYYVKAYATNSAGTAYGNEISFSTLPDATVPLLVTTAISSIASTSAVSGGTITNAGGVTITAKGVCWSTSSGPTIANSKTSNGSGTSGYASTMSGLSPNTTYYVRAYATNSVGTGYGNELTFTTLCSSYATVSVSITVSANPVCAGSAVTFTATPTNGGASPTYQWKVNASNITGATNATYSYTPINGDAVTCVLTSNAACVTGSPATSNTISMTVNPAVSAGITIATSANPVCAGTSVTFTATPVNGGSTPSYIWKVNGSILPGATGSTYSYIPANNDAVTCTMTSNAACVVGNPVVSNVVNLAVTPNLPVSVSISASVNPVSTGSSVTFTAVPVNGGSSPAYQWKVNGVNVGTNTPTYSYVPANNDSIKCVMISDLVCKIGSPATSNLVVMSINVMNIPCPGLPTVTYAGKTYNTVKIGNQCWLKENLNIGTRIDGVQEQTNNGTIEKYCYNNLESNCDIYGGLYQWNEMMQYLNTAGVKGLCPTGWHLPTDNDWCQMETFLDATVDCLTTDFRGTDAGGKMKETGIVHWASPNFGATNVSGFTSMGGGGTNSNGDFYDISIGTCFWTTSESSIENAWDRYLNYEISQIGRNNFPKTLGCASRCLKDTCSTYSSIGVSIAHSANPVCTGASVTFTATPTNGGTTPFYQWKVNSAPVGTNSPTYSYIPSNGDSVRCEMTSSVPCSANPATSNMVTMTVTAIPSFPTAGTHVPSQNQVQWVWNAVTAATGYKWSPTSNYVTATDMGTATTKTETGLNCDSLYTRFVWSYNTCGNSTPVSLTQSTSTCLPGCGSITVSHTAGAVAPVSKTVTYGTVINVPGEPAKCWITSNLGADHQATAVNDATEASAGWYWQFNRKQGYKHDGTTLTPGWTITGINESSDWIAVNDPCSTELGAQWHIPSNTDWYNLDNIGGWNDWNGPWSSGFKLHAAGFLNDTDGALHDRNSSNNSSGNYYSNAQVSNTYGRFLGFSSGFSDMAGSSKAYGFSVRCIKDCSAPPSAPSSGTHTPTQTQIIWNWSTTGNASGYKWNTTNDYASATDMGTATTTTETGLTCNLTYTRYAWAYNTCGNSTAVALNQTTSACGASSCVGTPTVSYGGQTYNTVQIGSQCWFKENLNIGTMISNSINPTNNGIIEKYCYNDDSANCAVYGGLYQWDEIMNYTASSNVNPSGRQGICPIGWHIPSDAEWCQLETWLDTTVNCTGYGYRGTDVGGKMKETGISHWTSPNTGATNSSGFTALPGGYRINFGGFMDLSILGAFWSSAQYNSAFSWHYFINFNNAQIYQDYDYKNYSYSGRCIKDCSLPSTPATGTNVPSPTQVIWNWNTVTGATGYKWNTTNDFASATDNGTATTKTEIGLTCSTTYSRYVWAYNSCGNSISVTLNQSTLPCPIVCGTTVLTINHATTGGVAPVNKTTTYGTITNIPGEPTKCWITSNLGSDHQATSVDDATEASAGWYWQFNRKQGYRHDGSTLTPGWTISSINESSDWITANDPCNIELGTTWRLPTYTEWYNVDNTGGWTDWNGPWNSGLKLHAAGFLMYSDGSLYDRGSNGNYWSSAQGAAYSGWSLSFVSGGSFMFNANKAGGYSARCVRD